MPYEQEQVAREYEAFYQTKYRRADQLEKKLLKKLLDQFKDAKDLLEVGCGTAHFTKWIESAFGLECFGVDKSKHMLREAKKEWPGGALLRGEGARLPFKNKSIDVLVYVTALEFMPDASVALAEAARVTKKGIILGLMNKNSPATLDKRLQTTMSKDTFYKEAKFYSLSDVKKILKKTLPGQYEVAFWSTTLFPKVLGNMESSHFPTGNFLGIAIRLRDINA